MTKKDISARIRKSVHSYIKTGVRNTQLDDLIELNNFRKI